ncbi:MAG: hypothetical protein ACXQS3_00495 [Candidatus Methanofastidiosia archaeon]
MKKNSIIFSLILVISLATVISTVGADGISESPCPTTPPYPSPIGPSIMMPIVAVELRESNSIWACMTDTIEAGLDDAMLAQIAPLADEVQLHMENAGSLSNPVYASGELNKAMALMVQINDLLVCDCIPN